MNTVCRHTGLSELTYNAFVRQYFEVNSDNQKQDKVIPSLKTAAKAAYSSNIIR